MMGHREKSQNMHKSLQSEQSQRSSSKMLIKEKAQTSPLKLNTKTDQNDELEGFNCITPKKVQEKDEEEQLLADDSDADDCNHSNKTSEDSNDEDDDEDNDSEQERLEAE